MGVHVKSKIKQITLTDGKQLFYPSDEEVKKLSDIIATITIEETMTKEEFNIWQAQKNATADMAATVNYCVKCDSWHDPDYDCMIFPYNDHMR